MSGLSFAPAMYSSLEICPSLLVSIWANSSSTSCATLSNFLPEKVISEPAILENASIILVISSLEMNPFPSRSYIVNATASSRCKDVLFELLLRGSPGDDGQASNELAEVYVAVVVGVERGEQQVLQEPVRHSHLRHVRLEVCLRDTRR
eukprot:TRINITY_DN2524_c0_g2_i4.p1 TRINITY_DN2524_c0_g2~~TRINITY_DN2524_c0_g2_i4.p1  ORF type:complete len:149 (+),score=4.41 TRINITY_DN2524_c0_g2_i4:56-502(+)